jgi:tetratricopeptide (TPR) repeat protein
MVGGLVLVAGASCNVDRGYGSKAPKGPVASVHDATGAGQPLPEGWAPAGQTEVDLVEEMVQHRAAYLRSLESLRDYYRDHGYLTKQSWADHELKGLRRVQTFRYVLDAEVPMQPLSAGEANPGADVMYERAQELMRKGGHRGLPGLYREGPMVEAATVFRELIERYPESDKIDDAAFWLGEIHKEYLKEQEQIAVQWYERAFEWDPSTPHPARFQAAVVYDFRLHDRDRALELYRQVAAEKTQRRSHLIFAQRRIDELTEEKSRSAGLRAMRD